MLKEREQLLFEEMSDLLVFLSLEKRCALLFTGGHIKAVKSNGWTMSVEQQAFHKALPNSTLNPKDLYINLLTPGKPLDYWFLLLCDFSQL